MEEKSQHSCQPYQVVAFNCVQVTIIAAFKENQNGVEDISGESSGYEFLNFEDEISGLVVGEVALSGGSVTLKKEKRMQRRANTTV